MNDTITPASSSQSKTSVVAVPANAKSRLDGRNAVDAADSSASKKSFQDSIEKAIDDSQQEKEITETESGGNDLPVPGDLADSAADDVRLLAMADFNIQEKSSDQLSVQVMPVEQAVIANIQSVSPDIESNVADELNVLSSQTRQLLKIDSNIKGKNAHQMASNTTATINTIEKSVIQSQDIPQLNSDQMELSAQKSQILTSALQQQMLSNSQTSLFSQTLSAQAELNNTNSPILLNPSVNNFSTMNLQSIPQAEIVETFARPAWSQGMGKQILLMVNQNINSAEIRLNPAHLGPIEVLIDMSEDQVNVSLSSRHAVVREAMEQALPKLREMLDANGFNLAEADILQHSFAQQREQNAENTKIALTGDSADQSVSSEINESVTKHLSSSTMVDYYI